LKEKNQVCYYGDDDDGMLNWKKLRAVGLCLGKFFYFNILQLTQNQNPKNNKDTFFRVGSVGKKLLQAVLLWLFGLVPLNIK